jgi:glucose-6-phosphate dehydrogenase assembly protein OpcA
LSSELALDVDWRGDDVTIGDVLSALNEARRRFAMANRGEDDEHPHPRNCVMTLIAVAPDAERERFALQSAMDIASNHPSLAIVIRDQPNIKQGLIRATLSAHPASGPFNKPAPCELVTLHVHGGAGSHLDALVDPLLVSGVPTYLWWLGTPQFDSEELHDALRVCDALVLDSASFARPYQSFIRLADMMDRSHSRLGLADFQWVRLTPWREGIAQFFSAADRVPLMQSISEVGIDYAGEGRGNRVAAALLTGWLASSLGWKLQRAIAGAGGVVSLMYQAEGWRPVEVVFRSVQRPGFTEGEVSSVRVAGAAGGTSFRFSVQRDPVRERPRPAGEFQRLHPAGGEDDAAIEIARRRAERQRDVIGKNLDSLHHTSTGDAPGESVPPQPTVLPSERRRTDTSDVMLTMIDIGDSGTLRHVQRVPKMGETAMLLELLSYRARDHVYTRALAAAAELMRRL